MARTYSISIDTDDPNIVGEYLRNIFWDQENGLGCYTSFRLNNDVKELPEYRSPMVGVENYSLLIRANNIRLEGTIQAWYWDGDGCLGYILPDGAFLVNSDCKKTNNWRWERHPEDYFDGIEKYLNMSFGERILL